MKIISTEQIASGQKVMIRSSLNVSLSENGQVADELRLVRMLDTIQLVHGAGGIPILISHIKNDQGSTLQPVVDWFNNRGFKSELVANYFPYNESIDLSDSDTLYIFENLRDYPGEKANNLEFALALSNYADLYVNESFDSAHREHASIVSLPNLLPAYAGLNFAAEVEQLSKVFTPDRPFTFIIGGAKIETKAPLITKLLDLADKVFVGGALANPLLQASGQEVGKSLLPDQPIDVSNIVNHPILSLPVDFIDQDKQVITLDEVAADSNLLDIGPDSVKALELLIAESDLVIWNGPLGYFEGGYDVATNAIAECLAKTDSYTIVGGGDTLAALGSETESKINWISTGGGAMLDFIESNGELPAISVLN